MSRSLDTALLGARSGQDAAAIGDLALRREQRADPNESRNEVAARSSDDLGGAVADDSGDLLIELGAECASSSPSTAITRASSVAARCEIQIWLDCLFVHLVPFEVGSDITRLGNVPQ